MLRRKVDPAQNLGQAIALLESSSKDALSKAGREAFAKVAGDMVETSVKALSTVLSSAISTTCGVFLSEFVKVFLKELSDSQRKLRQIEGAVSALVREPFKTGMEQLRLAIRLQPYSEKQAQHRIERYKHALVNLDRARSLASEKFEIALIDLFRGICTLELPGATDEAITHLTSFDNWAREEIASLLLLIQGTEREAKRLEEEWESVQRTMGYGIGYGRLGQAEAARRFLGAQSYRTAKRLRKEVDKLNQRKADLENIASYSSILLQALQKRQEMPHSKVGPNN
jgi:hypothetical protein